MGRKKETMKDMVPVIEKYAKEKDCSVAVACKKFGRSPAQFYVARRALQDMPLPQHTQIVEESVPHASMLQDEELAAGFARYLAKNFFRKMADSL